MEWKSEEGSGERLDRFISGRVERSRSQVQKDIEKGLATVNGVPVLTAKKLVLPGDTVTYEPGETPTGTPVGEERELDILYEDDYLVAINKPAGLVVHPNDRETGGTLVHALLHRYPQLKDAVYDPESEVSLLRPGIVHRLDKDTSGALLVAKDADTMRDLATAFQERTVKKEYLALVHGELRRDETVRNLLARKPFKRNMMGVSKTGEGREAVSHFHRENAYAYHGELLSLVRVGIETGRTHQIRVHAKYLGHPVLGDALYGNKPSLKLSERLGISRQLLHAATLSFTHPATGENLTLTAPLPEDFNLVLTSVTPLATLN